VLAVDDFHLAPENLVGAKRALLRFIDQQIANDDQVAIITTSGALGLFQQFTDDRAALQRGINRLSLQDRTNAHANDVPHISSYQAELIEQGDQDAIQIAVEEIQIRRGKPISQSGGRRRNGGTIESSDEDLALTKARAIVTENAQYTVATLSTLENTIRSLRELPGRKIMVLLSDGFFWGGARNHTPYDLRRITDAATRAGVVIYTLDARGLVAKPTSGSAADPQTPTITQTPGARERITQGEIVAKREGLVVLAKETGGAPFFNNNDLGEGLKRVLDDNEYYYVLAYQPSSHVRDGRFHKIEARIVSRPELRVQTRAGYFAPADKTPEKTAEKGKEKSPKKLAQEAKAAKDEQYRAALSSLVPLRGIPVVMSADFINTADAGPIAMITARLDIAGLDFEQRDGVRHNSLEIVGVAFHDRGKTANTFTNRIELNFKPESFEQAVKEGVSYSNPIALKPGFYNLKMVIADEGIAHIGSAFQWVEIPDLSKKELTLSNLFLAKEAENVYDALTATA
jgi:VWFA-related protein